MRQCARRGIEWGGDFSPLSDLQLAWLLRRCWIEWEYVPMEGVLEVVWPPAFGRHLVQLAKDQHPGARRFALRHGLGHVLGGHTEIASADAGDWRSFEERAADLFALVDVLPAWKLEQLRDVGADVGTWCREEIARWTVDWPAERVRDRVLLRFALEE